MTPAILLPAASYEFATIQKVSGAGPPVPASDQLAAEEPLDALVSYYGSALPQLHPLAPRVGAPSLHHFGDADAFIPMDTVGEIEAAVTAQPDVTFEIHPGAGHAFDNAAPAFHHPEASAAAWASSVAFLSHHLRTRAQYATQ